MLAYAGAFAALPDDSDKAAPSLLSGPHEAHPLTPADMLATLLQAQSDDLKGILVDLQAKADDLKDAIEQRTSTKNAMKVLQHSTFAVPLRQYG